jgi:ATP-dependent HslUV protease ATP-binding subunit HslU
MLLSSSVRTQLRSSAHRARRFNTNARWLTSTSDGASTEDMGVGEHDTSTQINTDTSTEGTEVLPTEDSDLEKSLRPVQVVKELDRHIVGQQDAKRAVAIAMRNRWRRRQLPADLRAEVTPRNVLMIGPTGCGKTEVARRMAALGDAPFLKVEATKFTEVGYHGRDVDQIIRDLMDISMTLTRKKQTEKMRGQAKEMVEDRILDLLTGPKEGSRGRESFRDMLRQGLLDDQEVEVDVPEGGARAEGNNTFSLGDNSNPNVQAMSDFLSKMGNGQGKKAPMERKKMPISEARDVILELEIEKLLENVDLKKEAIIAVEESGIVFIDEIDKICSSRDSMSRSADASAEGVQRDLLPLIEGTVISTKYGNVNTDYILFVASGAFHAVKPSDMLPELQGRLPIRVELNGLTEDDLYKILTEPVANVSRFCCYLYIYMSLVYFTSHTPNIHHYITTIQYIAHSSANRTHCHRGCHLGIQGRSYP